MSFSGIGEFNFNKEERKKDFSWIDNKYVPCEELFSAWKTARIILSKFCAETKYWHIFGVLGELEIGLGFPFTADHDKGEIIYDWETFPPEDRPKVVEICMQLMKDYLPDTIKNVEGEIYSTETRERMYQDIQRYDVEIRECGGRTILDELKFRLGVLW